MNTKIMEGLVGANTNINIVNTPMRIYRDAERRGDTATMERSMGYACEFAGKADEYKSKADDGMKEEAKELREKEQTRLEKLLEKRKEEREKLGQEIEDKETDKTEVNREEELAIEYNIDTDNGNFSVRKPYSANEPVIYTKSGEVNRTVQTPGLSVSI